MPVSLQIIPIYLKRETQNYTFCLSIINKLQDNIYNTLYQVDSYISLISQYRQAYSSITFTPHLTSKTQRLPTTHTSKTQRLPTSHTSMTKRLLISHTNKTQMLSHQK